MSRGAGCGASDFFERNWRASMPSFWIRYWMIRLVVPRSFAARVWLPPVSFRAPSDQRPFLGLDDGIELALLLPFVACGPGSGGRGADGSSRSCPRWRGEPPVRCSSPVPGHFPASGRPSRMSDTAGEIFLTGFPISCAYFRTKWSASRRMSLPRSRSGGR